MLAQVCVRSDSYVGLEYTKDIKLDVKAAREVPTQHPQWQECSSEEEGDSESEGESGGEAGHESEYTSEEITDESDTEGEDWRVTLMSDTGESNLEKGKGEKKGKKRKGNEGKGKGKKWKEKKEKEKWNEGL